jgi:hypothetical protein
MSTTRLPKSIFFAILAAGVLQCVHDFPLLPDRMASHFGASGIPNGWMTKSQFLIVYAVVVIPAAALEFWIPRRIAKNRARLNLPNKEYWLGPERHAETFGYLNAFFAWYGCAFLLLEVLAMGLAMRANFNDPVQLPTGPIVSALAAFLLFNVVAVITMCRRFSTPA